MPQSDQDKVFPDIDDVYHIDNKTINQIVDNAWINTNQACITGDSLDTWMMENKKNYPLYLTLEYVKEGKNARFVRNKDLAPCDEFIS